MSLERLSCCDCLSPRIRSDLCVLHSWETAWRLHRLSWPRMVADTSFKLEDRAFSLIPELLGQHSDVTVALGNNAARTLRRRARRPPLKRNGNPGTSRCKNHETKPPAAFHNRIHLVTWQARFSKSLIFYKSVELIRRGYLPIEGNKARLHGIEITLEHMTEPPTQREMERTTPVGLCRFACEFMEAALAGDDKMGRRDAFEIVAPVPVLFLVGQSIELVLKSFLLSRGVPLKKLRSDYGHSLHRLLRKSKSFPSFGPLESATLRLLHAIGRDVGFPPRHLPNVL